jgi:hypothetical protein
LCCFEEALDMSNKSNRGTALPTAILFITVFVIMASAMLIAASANAMQTAGTMKFGTHYYAAESAAQVAGQELMTLVKADPIPLPGSTDANEFFTNITMFSTSNNLITTVNTQLMNKTEAPYKTISDGFAGKLLNGQPIELVSLELRPDTVAKYHTESSVYYLEDPVILVTARSAGVEVTVEVMVKVDLGSGGGYAYTFAGAYYQSKNTGVFNDGLGTSEAVKLQHYNVLMPGLSDLLDDAKDGKDKSGDDQFAWAKLRSGTNVTRTGSGVPNPTTYTSISAAITASNAGDALTWTGTDGQSRAFTVRQSMDNITTSDVRVVLKEAYINNTTHAWNSLQYLYSEAGDASGGHSFTNKTINAPSLIGAYFKNPMKDMQTTKIYGNATAGGTNIFLGNFTGNPPTASTPLQVSQSHMDIKTSGGELMNCKFFVNGNVYINTQGATMTSNSIFMIQGKLRLEGNGFNNSTHYPQFYVRGPIEFELQPSQTYNIGAIFMCLDTTTPLFNNFNMTGGAYNTKFTGILVGNFTGPGGVDVNMTSGGAVGFPAGSTLMGGGGDGLIYEYITGVVNNLESFAQDFYMYEPPSVEDVRETTNS